MYRDTRAVAENSSNRLGLLILKTETRDPLGKWRVKWLTMKPLLSPKGHTTNTNLIEGKKY